MAVTVVTELVFSGIETVAVVAPPFDMIVGGKFTEIVPSPNCRNSIFVRVSVPSGSPFARARLLILIRDLSARPLAKAEQLRRGFGLTPGEALLAAALSNGTSLQDTADELGIGNETARTHLKGVFAKTGVNRQTALIALIARLGP